MENWLNLQEVFTEMFKPLHEKLWIPENECKIKIRESNRLMWYLSMYMYMLYCDADMLMKGVNKEPMDNMYIGSKIGYFFRSIKSNFASIDEFIEIASRETSAESIKKEIDVWLWIEDRCFQNYPKKVQDMIKSNPELLALFPDDIRDEDWYII